MQELKTCQYCSEINKVFGNYHCIPQYVFVASFSFLCGDILIFLVL